MTLSTKRDRSNLFPVSVDISLRFVWYYTCLSLHASSPSSNIAFDASASTPIPPIKVQSSVRFHRDTYRLFHGLVSPTRPPSTALDMTVSGCFETFAGAVRYCRVPLHLDRLVFRPRPITSNTTQVSVLLDASKAISYHFPYSRFVEIPLSVLFCTRHLPMRCLRAAYDVSGEAGHAPHSSFVPG